MELTETSPLPRLLSATAAAAKVGVSTNTIDAYVRRQGFPAPYWLGGRKWYEAAAVNAWLASPDRRINPRQSGEDHHNNRWPKEIVARAITLYNGGTGLSLQQIAERVGVPKATIHKWVNGGRRNAHPEDVEVRSNIQPTGVFEDVENPGAQSTPQPPTPSN